MNYLSAAVGITLHRDHRCYVRLVAVQSISGVVRFHIIADRASCNVIYDWEYRPGDLVQLRVPGLANPAMVAIRGHCTPYMNCRMDGEYR